MPDQFKPGQPVRLIDEALDGAIVRQKSAHEWLVKLEDGFEIPVHADDLVPASFDEAYSDPSAMPSAAPQKETPAETMPPASSGQLPSTDEAIGGKGVLMAFVKQAHPDKLKSYLINDAHGTLMWALYEQRGDGFKPIGHGLLGPGGFEQLGTYVLSELGKWRPLRLVYHLVGAGKTPDPAPVVFEYRFRASAFFRTEGFAPHVGEAAYVVAADPSSGRAAAQSLRIGAMNDEAKPLHFPSRPAEAGVRVVDLHDYALDVSVEGWTNTEILTYQLNQCEKVLDEAVREGCHRLVIIHGIGSGKLKKEVRRMLRGHPLVRKSAPANERDFGQGATEVQIS